MYRILFTSGGSRTFARLCRANAIFYIRYQYCTKSQLLEKYFLLLLENFNKHGNAAKFLQEEKYTKSLRVAIHKYCQ